MILVCSIETLVLADRDPDSGTKGMESLDSVSFPHRLVVQAANRQDTSLPICVYVVVEHEDNLLVAVFLSTSQHCDNMADRRLRSANCLCRTYCQVESFAGCILLLFSTNANCQHGSLDFDLQYECKL